MVAKNAVQLGVKGIEFAEVLAFSTAGMLLRKLQTDCLFLIVNFVELARVVQLSKTRKKLAFEDFFA